MANLGTLLLPAVFGLLGTLLGGALTIWGQHRADARAHEKRCEDYYAELATELVIYLRDRGKLLASALGSEGKEARRLMGEAEAKFPLSSFTLRAETGFPELLGHIQLLAQREAELIALIQDISKRTSPDSAISDALRREKLEHLLAAQHPLLAALVEVRSQLILRRPKRLNPKKILEAACAEASYSESQAREAS